MILWRSISAAMALVMLGMSFACAAERLVVEVINQSEPTLCAEKDNVSIALVSKAVRSFRVEATHPAYLPTLKADSMAPDFASCDMAADPSFKPSAPPGRQTIYEELDTWLVAWTFPSFWRPATATVRVGDRIERNIHMLQLWVRRPNGGEEVLVIYPQDGYWRLRPLAPQRLAPTAFGSSFLIGPVEERDRPVVRIKEVAFDPDKKTFTLTFDQSGSAMVTYSLDPDRSSLEVVFDKPITSGPFAVLRSMYITDFNNDVARIAVDGPDPKSRREVNIMAFGKAFAARVWTGRLSPSQHNTSSPDMTFDNFSDSESSPIVRP